MCGQRSLVARNVGPFGREIRNEGVCACVDVFKHTVFLLVCTILILNSSLGMCILISGCVKCVCVLVNV